MSRFVNQSFLFHSAFSSPRRCSVWVQVGVWVRVERAVLCCAALRLSRWLDVRSPAAPLLAVCSLSALTLLCLVSAGCRCRCSPPVRPFPLHTCSALAALASLACPRHHCARSPIQHRYPQRPRRDGSTQPGRVSERAHATLQADKHGAVRLRADHVQAVSVKRFGRNDDGWLDDAARATRTAVPLPLRLSSSAARRSHLCSSLSLRRLTAPHHDVLIACLLQIPPQPTQPHAPPPPLPAAPAATRRNRSRTRRPPLRRATTRTSPRFGRRMSRCVCCMRDWQTRRSQRS